MNKKIALFAIAMFAVTLGLGVLSPVLATQPNEDGEHKVWLCHFSEESNVFDDISGNWTNSTAGWVPINVDNMGQLKGHFDKDGLPRHFNGTVEDGDWFINATANPEDDDGIDDCIPAPVVTIGP